MAVAGFFIAMEFLKQFSDMMANHKCQSAQDCFERMVEQPSGHIPEGAAGAYRFLRRHHPGDLEPDPGQKDEFLRIPRGMSLGPSHPSPLAQTSRTNFASACKGGLKIIANRKPGE